MSSKPNILILIGNFNMGGAETQAVQLARLLLDDGHYNVHMACFERRGVLLEEAMALGLGEIPEFPLTSFYDRNMAVQLARFSRFVKEREIAVAHSQDFYMNVFGILGAARARVPVRIAFWGEMSRERSWAHMLLQRGCYRLAHAIHANSEAVKQDLVSVGVRAEKIVTLYNGLSMKRVTPPPDFRPAEALARLGLPAGRRFVTVVANLRMEVKDHPMFLRAARRVRACVPDAAFVCAGEGELLEPMRRLGAELDLGNDLFFTGRCERVAELLALSEVCVLSSKSEGFSNSILEYMAAARPVVVTDVGGAREAVIEGESGYIVKSGDEEAMAERIIRLLSEPERARVMGLRGRRVIEEKFSEKAQLDATKALYAHLLARSGGAREAVSRLRHEGA